VQRVDAVLVLLAQAYNQCNLTDNSPHMRSGYGHEHPHVICASKHVYMHMHMNLHMRMDDHARPCQTYLWGVQRSCSS
jgi:hypothetical protein